MTLARPAKSVNAHMHTPASSIMTPVRTVIFRMEFSCCDTFFITQAKISQIHARPHFVHLCIFIYRKWNTLYCTLLCVASLRGIPSYWAPNGLLYRWKKLKHRHHHHRPDHKQNHFVIHVVWLISTFENTHIPLFFRNTLMHELGDSCGLAVAAWMPALGLKKIRWQERSSLSVAERKMPFLI